MQMWTMKHTWVSVQNFDNYSRCIVVQLPYRYIYIYRPGTIFTTVHTGIYMIFHLQSAHFLLCVRRSILTICICIECFNSNYRLVMHRSVSDLRCQTVYVITIFTSMEFRQGGNLFGQVYDVLPAGKRSIQN